MKNLREDTWRMCLRRGGCGVKIQQYTPFTLRCDQFHRVVMGHNADGACQVSFCLGSLPSGGDHSDVVHEKARGKVFALIIQESLVQKIRSGSFPITADSGSISEVFSIEQDDCHDLDHTNNSLSEWVLLHSPGRLTRSISVLKWDLLDLVGRLTIPRSNPHCSIRERPTRLLPGNRVRFPAESHPGFSHLEIVPHDGASRRVFSGISLEFQRCCILTLSSDLNTPPIRVKRGERGTAPDCKDWANDRPLRKPADQQDRPARVHVRKPKSNPEGKASGRHKDSTHGRQIEILLGRIHWRDNKEPLPPDSQYKGVGLFGALTRAHHATVWRVVAGKWGKGRGWVPSQPVPSPEPPALHHQPFASSRFPQPPSIRPSRSPLTRVSPTKSNPGVCRRQVIALCEEATLATVRDPLKARITIWTSNRRLFIDFTRKSCKCAFHSYWPYCINSVFSINCLIIMVCRIGTHLCSKRYCRQHLPTPSRRILADFMGPRWLSGQTTRLLPRRTGFDPQPVRSRIFACGNRAGRCRFPHPFHSGAAPYSPRVTLTGSQDLDVENSPNI
ncbi:hypothetical protein PR048_002331 [Dryococelus australis]|uniref:Uncharacterized protein n=1 Tax=Dryococelus australis TaxID=614101 RepID=A0ABQ9IJX6_9NEOP|nr:hypothetical protein PR048_002331 [Dryococelus australis]